MGRMGRRLAHKGLAILLFLPHFAGWASAVPASQPAPPPEQLAQLLDKHQQSRPTLGNTRYVALLNYRQPSWEPRFYIIDTKTRDVVARYVVAHGRGSDPDHDGYADRFGDEHESHRSSLGFFLTAETYVSESSGHGLSMRLEGLSKSNRSAMARNIVIHANWYVEPDIVATQNKPGRSYGCLVFSNQDRDAVVEKLKGGALIYAAY
jgi:hypothetical protein